MFADALDGTALINCPDCDEEDEIASGGLLLATVEICVTVVPPSVRVLAKVVPPCTLVILYGPEEFEVGADSVAAVELITAVTEFTVCTAVTEATV